MAILSSKTFPDTSGINEYLSKFEKVQQITVIIETDDERQKKGMSRDELTKLIEMHHCDEWVHKEGKYSFGFAIKSYYWKNEEIHLTAAEQLYLYKRFVLKDDSHKTQRYLLQNMRKRLGYEFLKEVE